MYLSTGGLSLIILIMINLILAVAVQGCNYKRERKILYSRLLLANESELEARLQLEEHTPIPFTLVNPR